MPAVLREGHTPPPEHLLQQIWQYQRIHRGELRTTDGRRVAVLHPGFMNLEAGPDFQRAYIQVGRAALVECDVEIDVASGGWQQHGHHTNTAFSGVGLHVVWQAGNGGPTGLPVVELKDQLDAPVGELSHALGQAPTAQQGLLQVQADFCITGQTPCATTVFSPISCIGIRSKKDKKSICKGRQFR